MFITRDHVWLTSLLLGMIVAKFLGTFKDYPPRQKAASFSLDKVMEKLQEGGGAH
jgi:hypothetical protein